MDFHIIIPARLSSQRLPGKVLLPIAGKPLIQYVFENALTCLANSVTIAVDDPSVERIAQSFGAKTCMTAVEHRSGSERLAEVVDKLGMHDEDIIVNLQGDEPLISAATVQRVASAMVKNPDAALTTLCIPMQEQDEIFNPNVCKVVLDKNGYALYFSRAPIPYDRSAFDVSKNAHYRHLGMYAYRVKTLKKYRDWSLSPIEGIEMLEQLRVLWHGEKIHVSVVEEALPPGIDTEEDLEHFRKMIEGRHHSIPAN